MVALIGLLAPAGVGTLSVFGISLTTAAGGLTIAGSIFNLAAAAALSSLAPKPHQPAPENVSSNSKVAAGERYVHFGTVLVGGNAVFHRAKDGTSYILLVHGHGEIDGFETIELNSVPVALDGSGYVTDDQYQYGGRSRVRILDRLGDVPAAVYAEITAVWPEWTVDHRLDGLSTSLAIIESVPPEQDRTVFPNGDPLIQRRIRGSKVLDPRTGLVGWTDNFALNAAGWIANSDGFNRAEAIDWDDVAREADHSDAAIALAAGGAEPRWRVNGSASLREKPIEPLLRMMAACAGRIKLKANGKIAIRSGVWRTPEFTLATGHLLEIEAIEYGPDRLARYNTASAKYVDPNLRFATVDAEVFRDVERIAADNGELHQDITGLEMSPTTRQTRQAVRIKMERDNPLVSLSAVFRPSALPAYFEDVVTVNIPEFELTGVFEVGPSSLILKGGHLVGVRLALKLVREEAFRLELSEQGRVQNMPTPDVSAGVPLPQNVSAAPAGILTAQNAYAAGIGVAWQAPPSDALSPFLKVSLTGAEEWADVPVGTGVTNITIPGLIDGQGYDISLAFTTPGAVVGEAVIITNIVAAAVSDPPAAPTALTVSDLGSGLALVEVTAAPDVGLWKTEIHRDDGAGPVLAGVIYSGPSAQIAFEDNSGTGTFDWTARSVNVSGVVSATDAGPITQTIT